ncbi:MAG TPA: hypothetical protein VMU49_02240 [Candidatus Acidoferrales bacterium]|nr:hypothetical protein [Candidatus Acidoferrales bacterium]
MLQLLDRIWPDQLDLEVEHRRAAETKVKCIRVLLDQILVSHLESHVGRYRELRSEAAQTA